jgi:hypothetical protein
VPRRLRFCEPISNIDRNEEEINVVKMEPQKGKERKPKPDSQQQQKVVNANDTSSFGNLNRLRNIDKSKKVETDLLKTAKSAPSQVFFSSFFVVYVFSPCSVLFLSCVDIYLPEFTAIQTKHGSLQNQAYHLCADHSIQAKDPASENRARSEAQSAEERGHVAGPH